jgi:hypothetical protein
MTDNKKFCEDCYRYPNLFYLDGRCFASDTIGDTWLRAGDYKFVTTPMEKLNEKNDCPYYVKEKWWTCFSRKYNRG